MTYLCHNLPVCLQRKPFITKMFTMNAKNLSLKITNTDSKMSISKTKLQSGFSLPGNNRCIVKLLDKYLSLLPPENTPVHESKEKFTVDVSVSSFTNQRVGINSILNILSELSKKSGISVRYTNHSLQATAITRMFNAVVEEKIIAEKSGHRSL